MRKVNIKGNTKIKLIYLFMVIVILFIPIVCILKYNIDKENKIKFSREQLVIAILDHYNSYVKTNKEAYLFDENGNQVGKLAMDVELSLEEQEVDYETKYFKINNFDEIYYIKYQDVDKIEKISENSNRYKKYIVFNENIITNNRTVFYDEDNNFVYEFNTSFELPIIIKDKDKYGVEFQNRLLYIKNEDVFKVVDSRNTNLSNTKGIPVLNYHFVYKNGDRSCNEEICHSEAQMTQHFSYIKDNNFFTPTMRELEMYIDGKIRLPKSVVITFDDGARAEYAREYVDKYQLNATLFLITSWFGKDQFESEYLEIASHGDDLHRPGVCSGGQGGAIKCMEREKLLADLRASREKLDNMTYFCYPFYEFNEYSISVLKEAGYTMAFAGESRYSDNLVKVGSNKFKLPRFVVVNYTTMKNFIDYVNVE